ncbi:hypothetical protein N658DRAFT_485420 [Parathielavia hyrcaniae]|uniref:Protein prenyltransferase alpha subunit repeat-containing protein 1 n=1 Tax=Parathielavia hyrcaniae TaxID=113614 RepID=A0AAN6T2G8_9PEZI|nr:hypothetical protein N658DRAFT_485420 [Parathielavia hyrcaniae]
MSRVLDSETATSLKKGDALTAFRAISDVLTLPSEGLLEIEILGKSHILEDGQYVLKDGLAVGVSKLGLVQAFMVARQQLRRQLDGIKPLPDDDLFAATAVILLFDPEYLTAANARKRLIQSQLSGCQRDARARLEREKRFVDSLLTSRLHRHTKSPTLWSHRRWLLGLFASLGVSVDVVREIRDVVSVAGERHPRNYYAWCHARFLMGSGRDINLPAVAAEVQAWCFQHYTDISGWSFLYFLLDAESITNKGSQCPTFTEVLHLVKSLRLTNESVWVFLRTVAAAGLAGEEQYAHFLEAQAAIFENSRLSSDQAVLRAALEWCETYRQNIRAHPVDTNSLSSQPTAMPSKT